MQFCALDTGATHLVLSHLSGLLVDDPGDRLRERRRGQGARIRPVVPAGGQQAGGLEGAQGRPRILGEETAGSQVGGGGRGGGATLGFISAMWPGGEHVSEIKAVVAVVTFGNRNKRMWPFHAEQGGPPQACSFSFKATHFCIPWL